MEATAFYLLMLQKYINSKQRKRLKEIKDYTLSQGNVSKEFTINDMKKQD